MMRIAIPSKTAEGLFAEVEEHFGKAKYFTFVDVNEVGELVAIDVEEVDFEGHAPGQIPSWIKSKGADVVLTGGMGHRAIDFFNSLGIKVITGVSGAVKDVVKNFVEGRLKEQAEPCKESESHAHP